MWGLGHVYRATGSSPRVRGTPENRRIHVRRLGIIPACAGNTNARKRWRCVRRDHPRVCGEHLTQHVEAVEAAGSSPRVRGTLSRASTATSWSRIIPACAGNTCRSGNAAPSRRDHPRVCGEHNLIKSFVDGKTGSSPRVRGTPRTNRPHNLMPGIIPACAGNTQSLLLFGCRIVDAEVVDEFGIIPACAGNTHCMTPTSAVSWDHPRVCGEHVITSANKAEASGSSPRVRGTLRIVRRFSTCQGIIPACAGNTGRSSCAAPGLGDHPRVCGEHIALVPAEPVVVGSSPRVRGTQFSTGLSTENTGIIPACAGNTQQRVPPTFP